MRITKNSSEMEDEVGKRQKIHVQQNSNVHGESETEHHDARADERLLSLEGQNQIVIQVIELRNVHGHVLIHRLVAKEKRSDNTEKQNGKWQRMNLAMKAKPRACNELGDNHWWQANRP